MNVGTKRASARSSQYQYLVAAGTLAFAALAIAAYAGPTSTSSKPGTSPAGQAVIVWADQFKPRAPRPKPWQCCDYRVDVSDVAVGKDDTIVVGGQVRGKWRGQTNYGEWDGYVRVYSPSREVAWMDQLGGSYEDIVSSVAVGPDGRIYAAGHFGGTYEGFLRAYSPSGEVLWGKQGGAIDTEPQIAVTSDGTVVLVVHAMIRAYSPLGDVVWTEMSPNKPGSRFWGYVSAGGENLFAITGRVWKGNRLPDEQFVRVYSSLGDVVWTHQFGSDDYGLSRDVAMDVDGNVIVTGCGQWVDAGSGDYECVAGFVRAYSASGTVSWTEKFGEGAGRAATVGSGGTSIVAAHNEHQGGSTLRFYSRTGRLLGALPDLGGGSRIADIASVAAANDSDVVAAGNTTGAFLGFAHPPEYIYTTAAFVAKLLIPPDTPPSCDRYAATMVGKAGPDVLTGTPASDVIVARGGDDVIYGLGGADLICGGGGSDSVSADEGDDIVFGEGGNDMVSGGEGADRLDGAAGADTLEGGDGDDYLWGGRGDDHLDGGAGDDWVRGWNGSDDLRGGPGKDFVDGEGGDDEVHGGPGKDEVHGDRGTDLLYGDGGDDWLGGGDGQDVLMGGSGNDKLFGFSGDDELHGGSGDDKLDGNAGNDTLHGDRGNDVLKGGIGKGSDKLYGNQGDDRLNGGRGRDRCRGGSGSDLVTNCEAGT